MEYNILLCASGSVATIKLDKLFCSLRNIGNTKCVMTNCALHFYRPLFDFYQDKDEWQWEVIGDPVLHIDLKDWADVLVIAPLSANTLAKISLGLCDNLLTSIYRAYAVRKPIVLAPAMNTDMWHHPLTSEHLGRLKSRHQNLIVVEPRESNLACGTFGIGAMAKISDIENAVIQFQEKKS